MAVVQLPYGHGVLEMDVPDVHLHTVLMGRGVPHVSLEDAFERAWAAPIGVEDPSMLIRCGERVVFVVTDHTRATPTAALFRLIWRHLRSRVRRDDVTLLVATGTHRAPREDELEAMFGDLRREFRVVIHDCDRDLIPVGRSPRGTPILVNRLVAEADRVLTIGHVGMHYYAGYSGGRKNILPGVCGRATIAANHAQLLDSRCEGCVIDGNPIHEEMSAAAHLVSVDCIIDVVFGPEGQVAKVVVGDVEDAHAEARKAWDAIFRVDVREPADVVIASAGGHPKDIDLYQAYKALYNASRAVRDGGIVLLIAACPDGLGDDVFRDWLFRCDDASQVLQVLEEEGFVMGGHKAVYLARDLLRLEVHLKSELEPAVVNRLFLRPVESLESVLRIARERFGKGFRVSVIPHAGDVFPRVDPPGDAR